MNLFVTDMDSKVIAEHHCDVHLRKMIVELAQMLSTAHIVLDNKIVAYKKTHENHPCAVWLRKSSVNYAYGVRTLTYMLEEYERRFGKVHKTQLQLSALSLVPLNIPRRHLTNFVMAMPQQFLHTDPIVAYRRYMRNKLWKWKIIGRTPVAFTDMAPPEFLAFLYEDVSVPTGTFGRKKIQIFKGVSRISSKKFIVPTVLREQTNNNKQKELL
jgi:hypothetical protein